MSGNDEVKEVPKVNLVTELQPRQDAVNSKFEETSVENLVLLAKCQEEAPQQQASEAPGSVEPELVAEMRVEQPKQVETKLVVPKTSAADSDSDDTTSTWSREDSESDNDKAICLSSRRNTVECSGSESDWSDDTDDSDTILANNGGKEVNLPELNLADSTKNVAVEPPVVHDLTQSDNKDSDKEGVPDEEGGVQEQTDSGDNRVVEEDTTSEAETIAPEADPQCEEEAWKFIMSFVGGQQQCQAGRASTNQSESTNAKASDRTSHVDNNAIKATMTVPESAVSSRCILRRRWRLISRGTDPT